MISTMKKIIVFCSAFVISLLLFNHFSTRGKVEMTAEMNQAVLPVIYMKYDEKIINCLRGHTDNMDQALLQENITPIDNSKQASIKIEEFKNDIQQLDYKLTDISGATVIDEGSIKEFEAIEDGKLATITFKGNMVLGEEYSLVLSLKPNGGIVTNYYAGIIYEDKNHLASYLTFVNMFRESSFSDEKVEDLKVYLESKDDAPNNNLNRVDINASLDVIGWAGLTPNLESAPNISIKSLEGDIGTIEVQYNISTKDKNYYAVTEYYRLRYGADRIRLLQYERQQEEYFEGTAIDINKNAFRLGITSNADKEFVTDKSSARAAFVQNGQLWLYNYNENTMVKVFSFRLNDESDPRNDYNQHDVHIINLLENGDMNFVVYGYMNRGRHEGTTGTTIYHYSNETSTIEELLFLPATGPFQTMSKDTEHLLYLNNDKIFYTIKEGTAYRIDTTTKEQEIVAEDVTEENCVVSKDNRLVAIQDKANEQHNNKIFVYNLETGENDTITAPKGKRIKTIGYMGQMLIYGQANARDIKKKSDGSTFFPMTNIYLLDETLKKTGSYEKSGIYVTKAKVNGQAIDLSRVTKADGKFVKTSNDIIIRKEDSKANQVVLSYQYGSTSLNQLYMVFPKTIYINKKPKPIITKEALFDDYRTIVLAGNAQVSKYYVYANGKVVSAHEVASEAIEAATASNGSVINNKQQTIWKAGKTPDYAGIADAIAMISARKKSESAIATVAMILQYEKVEIDYTTLSQEDDNIDVIINRHLNNRAVNLSGCSLKQVLYFVGEGAPVIAQKKDGNYVLITSYNGTHIRYSDPVRNEVVKVTRSAFDTLINGNVFYSYVK